MQCCVSETRHQNHTVILHLTMTNLQTQCINQCIPVSSGIWYWLWYCCLIQLLNCVAHTAKAFCYHCFSPSCASHAGDHCVSNVGIVADGTKVLHLWVIESVYKQLLAASKHCVRSSFTKTKLFVSATVSNICLLFHFEPVLYFFYSKFSKMIKKRWRRNLTSVWSCGSLALVLKYKR